MMVANSFDLWQKDAFFSAAEEVQESADLMESTYREWIRERKDGLTREDLNELSRDLQTALGTAKWQLEEFERAVWLSHGPHGDQNTTARHGQFIAAIRGQIMNVEETLQEYINEEGKQPLRWINLDQEERDDLALFLSGTSQFLKTASKELAGHRKLTKSLILEDTSKVEDSEHNASASSSRGAQNELKGSEGSKPKENADKFIEGIPGTTDDTIYQADWTAGARRTWASPNDSEWKIVIADEDGQRNNLLADNGCTRKDKGSKNYFWRENFKDHPQKMPMTNFFSQMFGRIHVLHRQVQSPRHMQFHCNLQVMLALLITIFLIVPFVFYSA